jgi:hypothetical protein
VPGLQTTTEDTPIVFSVGNGNLVSIFDVDAAANDLEIVLTVTHGTLSLSGVAGLSFTVGDGTGDTTMTFRGTVGSINAALAGMVYTPDLNYEGMAKLTISVDDLGHNGAGGAHSNTREVNMDVGSINDAPIITAPASQTINEDNNLVFTAGGGNAISIFDVDSDPDVLEITVTATHGRLTLSGLTGLSFVTGDGTTDTTMTFRGTQAAINAALEGMAFSPDANYNGAATIQLDVNDLGHTGVGGVLSDSHTVNLTINAVNDAPLLFTPVDQVTDEDTNVTFSSGNGNQISIADVDVDEGTGLLSVTLTATHGVLTLSGINGLSFVTGDGTGDATMTFTGSLTNINAALNGLVFSPNLNYNGPASVQVDLSDQGNTGIGGTLTDSDTIGITVNAVNDGPTHSVPGAQTIDEDTPLVFSAGNGNAVVIDDVDAATVRVTLTVTNGRLTLSGIAGLTFIAGDGTADTTMTFLGTVANINAALEGMSYLGDLNFNGAASLSITTNDQGSVGSGGAKSASSTIGITVDAVNDGPVNHVPGQQTTNEDTDLVFSLGNGNSITISDVDAGGGIVRVTLTATHGTLTLGDITNVNFMPGGGDGVDDVTMIFTGDDHAHQPGAQRPDVPPRSRLFRARHGADHDQRPRQQRQRRLPGGHRLCGHRRAAGERCSGRARIQRRGELHGKRRRRRDRFQLRRARRGRRQPRRCDRRNPELRRRRRCARLRQSKRHHRLVGRTNRRIDAQRHRHRRGLPGGVALGHLCQHERQSQHGHAGDSLHRHRRRVDKQPGRPRD